MASHRVPPGARRGFIFVFGSRNIVSSDAAARASANAKCPRCGRVGALAGRRVRRWFTLFFVPVFPLDGGRSFTQCGHCGASFSGPPRHVAGIAARDDVRQVQRTIALYNGLRGSPANSVTLYELMALYLSIGEPEQAVGAAADFPDALNASEQCMVTLGRAYLVANRSDEAIGWLDTALARNPELAEAHFQRAVACLKANPPDLHGAVSGARSAQRLGYPGAADLLAAAQARGDQN